mmetsp:Transcript_101661/g.270388  ORF Transcript_101661/g.270388 Transcript_101661/m.270388 type:complete len:348 (-) Transcript_101661:106-1149(-)
MSRAAPDDRACSVELESGKELLFCPIRGLPVVRSQRVRALPGFHLLSLDAGKEALARGSYDAYGDQFPCQNLEYLHPEDKVFICPEDHKAFLNQMSMQYHRYICHELEERKEERKRLRARAAERKARSEAQAAQAQQRQQLQAQVLAKGQAQPQGQAQAAAPQVVPLQGQLLAPPRPAAPSAVPAAAAHNAAAATSAAALAGADAAAQLLAAGDLEPAEEPALAATDDPYAAAAAGEDPYLETSAPEAATTAIPSAASPAPAAAGPAAAGGVTAPSAAESAATVPSALAAVLEGTQPAATPMPRVAVAEEEDLYGDIGEREAKRSRTASTYATAMGAILSEDFDEDE